MKGRRKIDVIRERIVLAVSMIAVIVGAFVVNFLMLFSALSAVDQPRAEAFAHWYFFYWAVVFGGMILTAIMVFVSAESALVIGWITFGCAISMPLLHDSLADPGEKLFVLVPMAIGPAFMIALCLELARPDPASRRAGGSLLAAPFVIAGVGANWFLAGLMFAPLYLLGAAAAIVIPRWPRYSWVGGIVAAAFVYHGIRAIPECDPYFGVVDPLARFGIPAAIFLGLYLLAVPWMRRHLEAREQTDPSPTVERAGDPPDSPPRTPDEPQTAVDPEVAEAKKGERLLWSA